MLYALLSPAKRLDFKPLPDGSGLKPSQPALLKDTAVLAKRVKALSRDQIGRLMDISAKLAALNFERFQSFDPANRKDTKPAILTFAGDVYIGLQAKTLVPEDIAFAQSHIAIISGLYGVLRPLDAIQPYRLEMGSPLDTDRGRDLYAFWRDRVTTHLNSVTAKLASPTIVNLASIEYFSVVDAAKLKAPVIQPTFKEIKAGKAQIVSFFAKKARGLMARAIIDHRWTDPEQMKAFKTEGYAFDARASDAGTWVFSRKTK